MAQGRQAVTVGQVWKDNDKRMFTRYVQVQRIEGAKAVCWLVAFHPVSGWILTCKRETRIALRRFRPTSTGYTLVHPEPRVWRCHCPIENHNDVQPGTACVICGGMQ